MRAFASIVIVLCLTLAGAAAHAVDLVGANYRLRGGSVSGGSTPFAATTAPAPRYGGSGVGVGQGEALGFGGSSVSLTSVAPGFWPIAAGTLPNLDTDDDGLQSFFDDDDDGDGLLDVVETGTGIFVSPGDTGTSPVLFDTDTDGLDDGTEVANGTDPNDPASPPPPALPALGVFGAAMLGALLALAGARSLRSAARSQGGSR